MVARRRLVRSVFSSAGAPARGPVARRRVRAGPGHRVRARGNPRADRHARVRHHALCRSLRRRCGCVGGARRGNGRPAAADRAAAPVRALLRDAERDRASALPSRTSTDSRSGQRGAAIPAAW
jgi:hypothetical protein